MFIPIGDDIQRRTIPIVPSFLIVANVLVFAYQTRMVIDQGPDGLEALEAFFLTWGLVPKDLAGGQVIGMLTHMFVHGGFMHLLGNMIVLWTFACTLEAGLGSAMLLAFYMVWGIAGGLAHVAIDWGGEMPMVGASGAIAGLMGTYTVAYGPQAKIKALFFFFFRPFVIQIPAFAFGLGWIFMQLWHASNDPAGISGVAWFAHIGGFGFGALTMFCMRNGMEQQLVRDNAGSLVFQQREEQAVDPEVAAAAEAATRLPDLCPHCQTALVPDHVITPTLARCANEGCDRLIYPESLAVG